VCVHANVHWYAYTIGECPGARLSNGERPTGKGEKKKKLMSLLMFGFMRMYMFPFETHLISIPLSIGIECSL